MNAQNKTLKLIGGTLVTCDTIMLLTIQYLDALNNGKFILMNLSRQCKAGEAVHVLLHKQHAAECLREVDNIMHCNTFVK